jgi:hypothetical protein
MFQTNVVENINTLIFKNPAIYGILWKNTVDNRLQYGECPMHARYLTTQIHIQNM